MKKGRLFSLILGASLAITSLFACSDNEPIDARNWSPIDNVVPPTGGAGGVGADGGAAGVGGGAQAGSGGSSAGNGGTGAGGTGATGGSGASAGFAGAAGSSGNCQDATFNVPCTDVGAQWNNFICACGLQSGNCDCRCIYTWLQDNLVPCTDAGAGGSAGFGGSGGAAGGSAGFGGTGAIGGSGGSTGVGGSTGLGGAGGGTGGSPGVLRGITYRWILRNGVSATHLTGFDEVFDGNGNHVPRAVPCGANPPEAVYSWGAAQDCPNGAVCFSESMLGQASYACTVHRPAGAIPQANAHMILAGTNAGVWACANADGSVRNADFEVRVDGVLVPFVTVIWPQPGSYPFCRDVFQIP